MRDFADFVASQQEPNVDSEAIRDEWLKNLNSLYQMILDFLRDYVDRGSIRYDFTEIELNEPELGSYRAKAMVLKIGRQLVRIEPVGTLFVACKGRVDVTGPVGRAQMLLIEERVKSATDLIKVTVSVGGSIPPSAPKPKRPSSWVWKIPTSGAPKAFVDLDQKSFFDLVMEVSNA